ncbi:exodeoxyribonuclease V subunit alpha [Arsenicicoccus piscis]
MSARHFAITDPLPEGTVLLEASAGTGKTWTIAALVTRYVAEGVVTLPEMLVVTFGRAASQELRSRVREQLYAAERALDDPPPVEDRDQLLTLLLAVDEDERLLRLERLRTALTSFDAATIATTHQFCQQVLRSLGVAGNTDAGAQLVDDLDDLLVEVVDDLYLRGFVGATNRPIFSRRDALAIARRAIEDDHATLAPSAAEPGSVAARRVGFAQVVRREMDVRKRRLQVMHYNDLLTQLADALTDKDSPARARMQARWRVVLVDEFQDTDPVQWQVLDRAFTGVAHAMVLIGDPKQAIYAFRGGDIVTYLEAAQTAQEQATLPCNFRSDAGLVRSIGALLGGAALGDPQIIVHDVEAQRTQSRLHGAPHPEPLRLRQVRQREHLRGNSKVGAVRAHIARDLALDVAALLDSGATFDGRPLHARDVAVIAHTSRTLIEIQQALRDVGIHAVSTGGSNVLQSKAAHDWLALLTAMAAPHRSMLTRAAALTDLVGLDVERLATGGDDLDDELAALMRRLATVYARQGAAAVIESLTVAGLPARVLGRVGGERELTDLRHVGQLLHEVGQREQLGLVALLEWLQAQLADDTPVAAGARTRRLDSDAAAVQLVTVHGSKGLQYPVVYLPALSDRWVSKEADIPLFHTEAPQRTRCIDVGGPSGPEWADSVRRHKAEEAGESLRLLYVALTRAQSQVVAWWAPSNNVAAAPLHRALFGRSPIQAEIPDTVAAPKTDDDATERLSRWAEVGAFTLEPADLGDPVPAPVLTAPSGLGIGRFDRVVDTSWRRTSYSALSAPRDAEGHELSGGVGSEPEVVPRDDEPEIPVVVDERPTLPGLLPGGDDLPSPMADLPVGATFGSLVHAVLEHADPQAVDLDAELRARIGEQLVWWPVDVDVDRLVHALVAVLDTPSDRWPAAPPCARPAREIACASWTSSCRSGAVTWRHRPAPAGCWVTSPRCCVGTSRPVIRCVATPTSWTPSPCWPSRSCAATSPGRSTWCCGSTAATWSSTTRPTGWASSTPRSLPGPTAPRRWSRRWGTPAIRSRRCCMPLWHTASCAGECRTTTRTGSWGRALPLPAGHVWAQHPRRRRPGLRGLLLAASGRPRGGRLRPPGRRVGRWRVGRWCVGRRRGCGWSGRGRGANGQKPPTSEGCVMVPTEDPKTAGQAGPDGVEGHRAGAEPIERFEPTGPFDRRLALGAQGRLKELNEAGVLTAADVHLARTLARAAHEQDEDAVLAAALAVRAVRQGSVAVDLTAFARGRPSLDPDGAGPDDVEPAGADPDGPAAGKADPDEIPPDQALPWPDAEGWTDRVAASALAAQHALVVEHGLVYLQRYHHQERQVVADLHARAEQAPPVIDDARLVAGLERVFPGSGFAEQRGAAERAVRSWTTVLTGGPGTGKTTTVAGVLALLAEQVESSSGRPVRVALAAPTGKAAARMQEAVSASFAAMLERTDDPAVRARIEHLGRVEATTVHRLLGRRPDSRTRFRHDRAHRLPHDVVLVDEASMVSLTHMARLLEAVRPTTRLILVGDPDQLVSVDAGAVLADLVAGVEASAEPPLALARLSTPHRYGAAIGRLAEALRRGDADAVVDALQGGGDEVRWLAEPDPAPYLRAELTRQAVDLHQAAAAGDAERSLALVERHRLLCAHRSGPFGVRTWNHRIEGWLSEATGDTFYDPMYVGRPVLVTANDYATGVFNGDVGVVVAARQGAASGRFAMIRGAKGDQAFGTGRLGDVETMHAMTIHKSQGSQATHVTVLLPELDSPLLTRELFYTAVTRAQERVTVVGSEEVVRAAVARRVVRASGLRARLAQTTPSATIASATRM